MGARVDIRERLRTFDPQFFDGGDRLHVMMRSGDTLQERDVEFLASKGYEFAGIAPEPSGASTADFAAVFKLNGGMGLGF